MATEMLGIVVSDWKHEQHSLKIDTDPDVCPICHRAIEPIDPNWNFLIQRGFPQWIERVLRCPKKDCHRLFIARYYQDPYSPSFFRLHQSVPAELMDIAFAAEIRAISPDFCAIYNEAHKAEQQGYLLVCGPGYRKALEFLVKDYVIKAHRTKTESATQVQAAGASEAAGPGSEEQVKATDPEIEAIKKMQLGACIAKYVSSEKVKQVAARAAWLGNDETHYLRKWGTKDLKDLKLLIDLTVHWIEMEELTTATIKDMPEGKK